MILITGANGFVGRSVQKALSARNIEYRNYDGDIRDFHRLRDELSTSTTVIHLAGAESRGRPHLLQEIDINGADTLLQALKFRDAQRVIFLSRINAQPNSSHVLLRAKGQIEQQIRNSGLPHTIIRSTTLFGKDDRFTNSIATTAAWSWPFVWLPKKGEGAMQPLWVEDAARAIVDSINMPTLIDQTVTIAGDERLSYREIVTLVLNAAKLRRYPLNTRPLISRSVNRMTSWSIYHPPITRFNHDRFTLPEIADLNSVYSTFNFRPARLSQHLSHLRRPGVRRLLWQL